MRFVFCTAAISVFLLSLSASATTNDASIYALTLRVADASQPGALVIEITNSSPEPIGMWTETNSWGAAHWRVMVTTKDHLEVFFQNPDQGFTINLPESKVIAAGSHITKKLDINGGNWCGFGHCSLFSQHGIGGREIKFEKGAKLVVIYDVPVTDEARANHVWYGVATASSIVP